MISLYYWNSPNVHKVAMLLEEAGLTYEIKPVDVGRGEQFDAVFLDISPNNRLPAIVDATPDGGGSAISLFESGAILLYLAGKAGRFAGENARERAEVLQWLFWQVGGLGPTAGQSLHFQYYAPEPQGYAVERFVKEASRLYAVLDIRLADRRFIAGDGYSIADMASYPWILLHERQRQDLADFPNVARWMAEIQARPATQRAYDQVRTIRAMPPGVRTEAERGILFGQTSETVRAARRAAGRAAQ